MSGINWFIDLCLILIILISVGFFFVRKRKYKLTFSVGLFFLSLLTIWSYYKVHKKDQRFESRLVGEYKLNINKSKLNGYEPQEYDSIILFIQGTNDFHLTKDVSFMYGKFGTWKYRSFSEGGYAELKFSNGHREQFSATSDKGIVFYFPKTKRRRNSSEKIVF
jgi:energy-coupling factor transporter transmembrane protein EcfT